MKHTMNDVLRTITEDYLAQINRTNLPSPASIEADLLDLIHTAYEIENAAIPKGRPKWKLPLTLEFTQIAQILAALYPICKIETAGDNSDSEYDLLGIYQEDGPDAGIYVTSDEVFRKLARSYNYRMTLREYNEMMTVLKDIVPRKQRCTQPNLVAVNNGIFDYDTKQLLAFTPNLVFLSKSKVNYNASAKNITIHNPDDNTDWDVESWMNDLSDDPEVVNSLWEILGAIIRPNVAWNKSAWFYSESGNNGKGTLCELMRQLCGKGSYAVLPLSEMGKDFMLEPLTRATAIIVDENDVGTFIDKAANLKALITGDAVQINRKFKQPISYQFHGFMVQCLNEMPRIRDKTDSFFRRQLFIPFLKCFTGKERKYIKQDYLHRQDVLEYVLYRVLHMNYYTLSEPDVCKQALEEYKEFNDPLRQFADEILPECKWDLLPFTFLYELYRSWFTRYIPSGSPISRNTFIKDIVILTNDNDIWDCPDKNKKIKSAGKMDMPEPLILEYNLTNWGNPRYLAAKDRDKYCIPANPAVSYRGLTRRPANPAPTGGNPS